MNTANIRAAASWFQVLQTTDRAQTAVMTLAPGQASGDRPNTHDQSDQVLIVVEGEVVAEVADDLKVLKPGDVVVVPAGTPHRFANQAGVKALTFSVYAPPEYPPHERG